MGWAGHDHPHNGARLQHSNGLPAASPTRIWVISRSTRRRINVSGVRQTGGGTAHFGGLWDAAGALTLPIQVVVGRLKPSAIPGRAGSGM